MRNVLIYLSEMLPPTQTFVLAQARALTRYRPHFVGLAPAKPSVEFGDEAPCLLTRDRSLCGRLRKAAYRATGYSPDFHRRASSLRPCLIHVHFAEDGPMALPLAVDLGLPMIVTLHGSVEPIADKYLLRSFRNAMYVMKRRATWQRTAKFLCVSKFIRDVAIEAGYPKEKLLVHYIGIDLTRYCSSGVDGRDRNLVLFVGRLDEKKGCRYLIAAIALVQRDNPGVKLVIIGNGSLRAALEAQAKQLGIGCTFAGTLSPAAVSEYLKKAWVFCGPSVRARDGRQRRIRHGLRGGPGMRTSCGQLRTWRRSRGGAAWADGASRARG